MIQKILTKMKIVVVNWTEGPTRFEVSSQEVNVELQFLKVKYNLQNV